jgi:sarcosine oxidase, subunit gamma
MSNPAIEIAPLETGAADLVLGSDPVVGAVRGAAVRLAPAAPARRYSLRARDPAVLSAAIGRALPERIGTQLDGIARLGPDEWLAVVPVDQPLPVPAGQALAVTEVSGRSIGFTLTGPGAAAAIARGCPLDLARFAPGRATRTVFETAEILLWAIGPEEWRVEVWRSFAPWLWHSLAEGIV